MTGVWVVMAEGYIDGSYLRGVFSTKEAAKAWADERLGKWRLPWREDSYSTWNGGYEVVYQKVDEPDE